MLTRTGLWNCTEWEKKYAICISSALPWYCYSGTMDGWQTYGEIC